MAKATLVKELNFSTPDQPGMLEKVTSVIASKNINLTAITAYAMQGAAHFMLVSANSIAAKMALEEAGFKVEEKEAVSVEVENKPGAAQKMALTLKQAGLNLSYIYGTTCNCTCTPCNCVMILSSNDNKKAVGVLGK